MQINVLDGLPCNYSNAMRGTSIISIVAFGPGFFVGVVRESIRNLVVEFIRDVQSKITPHPALAAPRSSRHFPRSQSCQLCYSSVGRAQEHTRAKVIELR